MTSLPASHLILVWVYGYMNGDKIKTVLTDIEDVGIELVIVSLLVQHQCQDGRVVKALALRSNGQCPRGFEPHSWQMCFLS